MFADSTAISGEDGNPIANGMRWRLPARLNRSSPVPLYLQARDVLADAIRQGVFAPASQLPSTTEIARHLRVSLLTAHRALQQLTQDGWLLRGRGQRTFVRADFQAAVDHAPRFRILIATTGGSVDGWNGSTPWGYLHGIEAAAAQIVPPTERIIQHYQSPDELTHVKADGIIAIQPRPEHIPGLVRLREGRPVVLVGVAGATGLDCVDTANQEAARSAVGHLAELGHERIALILDSAASAAAQDLLCGFMLEMSIRGLSTGNDRIISVANAAEDDARHRTMGRVLHARNRPTAIVAGDLHLAMRIRADLQREGFNVPRQISLIGFGDEWFTGMLHRPLTVIAQPVQEMARRGFSRLLQILSGQSWGAKTELLPASLVIRGTTAPPARPIRRSSRRRLQQAALALV